MIGVLRTAFWGAVGLIAYVAVVFPAVLVARARRAERSEAAVTPVVDPTGTKLTVVIAAHNEERVIEAKIQNTLALRHEGSLEVVVACDGCTDRTVEIARAVAAGEHRITVLELSRSGKNGALRSALGHATGDVVMFTDADALLESNAASLLVASIMNSPDVGGAAGRVVFGEGVVPSGERAYWKVEDRLRVLQARGGSLTAAPGPLFAIRRELIDPPPDGVTDDFWISVQVPLAGLRLVFVPDAIARLPEPPPIDDEFRRKVRIICAGLRGVWRLRRRYRFRWVDVQIITHKGLRRLTPLAALVAVVLGILLRTRGVIYRMTGYGGTVMVCGATAAWLLRATALARTRPTAIAAHVAVTTAAVIVALRDLSRGERHDQWTSND